MKKTVLYIFMMAAAAVAFSSCENKLDTQEPEEIMSFTASMEATKTTIDGINVLWTPGDEMNLYSTSGNKGVTFSTAITAPAASAVFSGTGAEAITDIGYVAMYPTSQVYKITTETAFYTIPHEQIAVKGQVPEGGLALYGQSADLTTMKFMHCNAYLKFTIGPSSPAIKRIIVSNIAGHNISGGMKISNTTRGQGTNTSQPVFDNVIFSAEDDEALEQGTYYIALKPMNYQKGLKFTFVNPDDATAEKSILPTEDHPTELLKGDVMDLKTIGNLEFKASKYSMGSVYEDGTDKGVIFWIDPANPKSAKIVSAWSVCEAFYSGKESWGDELKGGKAKYEDDAAKCLSALKGTSVFAANKGNFAFMKCETEPDFAKGGWYMPCRFELMDIYDMYCGFEQGTCRNGGTASSAVADIVEMAKTDDATAERDRINKIMVDLGGKTFTEFKNAQLWSCSFNSGGTSAFVQSFDTYALKSGALSSEKMVRCIKKVTLE